MAPLWAALGLGAALCLALVSRFSENVPLWLVLAGVVVLPLAALLAGTLYSLTRRRDEMATAIRADALLGLDERLATALESSRKPRDISLTDRETLTEAQLDDALRRADHVNSARALPARVEARRLVPAGGLLVLILAALVFPALSLLDPQARAVQEQIAQEQQKVEELAEELAKDPRAAVDPELQALLQELAELSRDLESGGLEREEAVARLSQAESELEKQLDPAARGEREALEKLAEQIANAQSEAARELGDALKSGDEEELADALDKLAEEMKDASESERRALAESLREARDQVAALDPETAQRLNEAADALKGTDPEAAEKALEALGERVTESMERAATQEQIRQALSQLQSGKENIAQAGQPTAVAGNGTAVSGTSIAANGTPASGTSVAGLGSPVSGTPLSGTAVARGSAVAIGSPVQGTLSGTGTPVVASGGTQARAALRREAGDRGRAKGK
jgi:hypothetical protein